MNRQHVFLDAMGLGPQWRLRHAPAAAMADAMAEAAGEAAGLEGAAVPGHDAVQAAPVASTLAAMPAAGSAMGTAAAVAALAAAPVMPGVAPEAHVPVAGMPGHTAAARAAGSETPNPAVARHTPTPAAAAAATAEAGHAAGHPPAVSAAPATPRAAPASGEDTSWFDDAPAAPSTRPALKSPPPAKAPPPARPAAHAAASPAAGAGGRGDGTAGAAGAESYAWFDDVPATPISKPVRKAAPEPDAADEAPWRDAVPAVNARRPARPGQAGPAASAFPAMPDDGMPWFDDAPLPSLDASFDVSFDAAFDAGFDAGFDAPYGDTGADAGVSTAAIARMDRAALQAAVQSCTRCTLCRERGAAVPGRGADSAPWLVLATAPNADDEAQGRPLAGAPGQLLDNMLKAINVAPQAQAYVTTLVKCRPQGDRAPTAEELAACRPYLERELALAGSRAVITLGHTAAKGLLGAAARGKVLRLEQIPVVATYHPADLLRKPEDKARAWADLCLARAAFDGRA